MKRIALVAAFLLGLCASASAQFSNGSFGLYGFSPISPVSAPAYQGPVDAFGTGVIGCWTTTRACSQALATPTNAIMDVVDSATGATSCTFHAQTSGFVNPSECNATACATACKVKKIYNQVNPGTCDMTQATLANMPALTFSAINGLPAPTYTSGSSMVLSSTGCLSASSTATMAAVFKRTATVSAGFISISGTQNIELRGSTTANTGVLACGINASISAADNAFHGLIGYCSGVSSTSAFNIDGSDTANVNAGTNAIASSALVRTGESVGAVFLTGLVPEALLYSSATNATQRGAIYSNWHGANGYNGAF